MIQSVHKAKGLERAIECSKMVANLAKNKTAAEKTLKFFFAASLF